MATIACISTVTAVSSTATDGDLRSHYDSVDIPGFNAIQLPANLFTRFDGSMQWIPPPLRKTSNGAFVVAGTWQMLWRWRRVTATEFDWYVTSVLGGAATVGANIQVWNQNGILNDNLRIYSNVRLHYPTWSRRNQGYFWDFSFRVTHIITAPPLPNEQFFTIGLSLVGSIDKVSGG